MNKRNKVYRNLQIKSGKSVENAGNRGGRRYY